MKAAAIVVSCMCVTGVAVLGTPQVEPAGKTPVTHTLTPTVEASGGTRAAVASRPPTRQVTAARTSRALHRLPAVWVRLAACESSLRVHAARHRTYYGLWQIHRGWYRAAGINPHTASIEQQYRLAQHIYRKQGAKAWPYCHRKAGLR